MVDWNRMWHTLSMSKAGKGISYADPLRAGQHPMQVYLLSLCALTSIPSLAGLAEPGTLEALLPVWLVRTWSGFLLVGSVLGLIGAFWTRNISMGLTMERIGLGLVGVSAIIYGPIIFFRFSWGGLLLGVIIFGLGMSCIKRARDIGSIIKTATAILKKKAEDK